MEDALGDSDFKNIPQLGMNLNNIFISSYFSILCSPERLGMIKQEKYLVDVLGDIGYDCLGGN